MHKSDMKSNPNDRGRAGGAEPGRGPEQPGPEREAGPAGQAGPAEGPAGRTATGSAAEGAPDRAGDQDVENPTRSEPERMGSTGPAGKNKPKKGMEHDDQDDRDELDDEDVDTAGTSRQKRNEKRQSM